MSLDITVHSQEKIEELYISLVWYVYLFFLPFNMYILLGPFQCGPF